MIDTNYFFVRVCNINKYIFFSIIKKDVLSIIKNHIVVMEIGAPGWFTTFVVRDLVSMVMIMNLRCIVQSNVKQRKQVAEKREIDSAKCSKMNIEFFSIFLPFINNLFFIIK